MPKGCSFFVALTKTGMHLHAIIIHTQFSMGRGINYNSSNHNFNQVYHRRSITFWRNCNFISISTINKKLHRALTLCKGRPHPCQKKEKRNEQAWILLILEYSRWLWLAEIISKIGKLMPIRVRCHHVYVKFDASWSTKQGHRKLYSVSIKKGNRDSILNLSKPKKTNHKMVISGW